MQSPSDIARPLGQTRTRNSPHLEADSNRGSGSIRPTQRATTDLSRHKRSPDSGEPRRSAIHCIPHDPLSYSLHTTKPPKIQTRCTNHIPPAEYVTRLCIKLFTSDDFAPEDWDSLDLAWHEAFHCIPAQHHIENVLLDLHRIDPFEVPHVVPLLQEVSTEMYAETKGESGRELVFGIVRAERQKKWIEAQLPGKSEDVLFEEQLRAVMQGRAGDA